MSIGSKFNTVSWISQYENREPPSLMDEHLANIRYFRWELNLAPDDPDYSLDELKIKYIEENGLHEE